MLARSRACRSLARDGVPWDWRHFGDASIASRASCVNTGFLVGHSALRRVVMGEGATGRHARPGESTRCSALLRGRRGGLGFSSSWATTHNDDEGERVPSRYAVDRRVVALVQGRVGDEARRSSSSRRRPFEEHDMELMRAMSLAAVRPLNWNVLE